MGNTPYNGDAVKQIARVTWLRQSASGNPRAEVVFSDGSHARTKPDAACAYGIANPENMAPNEVLVTFERGQIIYVKPVQS